ncbi:MAG: HEAT repeat domain-containing protein [Planctomycetaceae bacterium]
MSTSFSIRDAMRFLRVVIIVYCIAGCSPNQNDEVESGSIHQSDASGNKPVSDEELIKQLVSVDRRKPEDAVARLPGGPGEWRATGWDIANHDRSKWPIIQQLIDRKSKAIPALRVALHDAEPSVRCHAAAALSGTPEGRDILYESLKDADPLVQYAAAMACCEFFGQKDRVRPVLEQGAADAERKIPYWTVLKYRKNVSGPEQSVEILSRGDSSVNKRFQDLLKHFWPMEY